MSLCFLFLRILTQPYARYTIIAATCLSAIANIIACMMFLVTCGGPRQASKFLFEEVCLAPPYVQLRTFLNMAIYFPVYINIAVDIIFSLIPIPMLLQTTLDRKQKISVSFFLALSTMGCICAVGKVFFSYPQNRNMQAFLTAARTWTCFNTSELAAYIIGGCLAAYRPLFTALGRRINATITTKNLTRMNATNVSSMNGDSQNRQSVVQNHVASEEFDLELNSRSGMAVPFSPTEELPKEHFYSETDETRATSKSSMAERGDAHSMTALRHGIADAV
jgi:hypothetical protein